MGGYARRLVQCHYWLAASQTQVLNQSCPYSSTAAPLGQVGICPTVTRWVDASTLGPLLESDHLGIG